MLKMAVNHVFTTLLGQLRHELVFMAAIIHDNNNKSSRSVMHIKYFITGKLDPKVEKRNLFAKICYL